MNKQELTELCESLGITVAKKDTDVTLQAKVDGVKKELIDNLKKVATFIGDPGNNSNEEEKEKYTDLCVESASKAILLGMESVADQYITDAISVGGETEDALSLIASFAEKFPEAENVSPDGYIQKAKAESNRMKNQSSVNTGGEHSNHPDMKLSSKHKSNEIAKQIAKDFIEHHTQDGKELQLNDIKMGIEVAAELLAAYQIQQRKKNKPTGRIRIAERQLRLMSKRQLR